MREPAEKGGNKKKPCTQRVVGLHKIALVLLAGGGTGGGENYHL